jgi:hypothetical protein
MVVQAYPRDYFRQAVQPVSYSVPAVYDVTSPAVPASTPQNDNTLAFYGLVLGVVAIAVFGGILLIYLRKKG